MTVLSRRASRVALSTLTTGALVVTGLVAAVGPAQAGTTDELYPRPASGVYELDGHGWGHGRGMSQYGARGAAQLGKSADEITSTYYPNTQKGSVANTPIRVLIDTDDEVDTKVRPQDGLFWEDQASGVQVGLPAGPTAWRTVAAGGVLLLQSTQDGSGWTTQAAPGGATTFQGPTRFYRADKTGDTVRVELPGNLWRDYRGSVFSVRTAAANLATVVHLPLEDYLRGVVPRESPASWEPEALKAQAIAARSYSVNKRDRVNGAGNADICDTTACQVFGGTRVKDAKGAVTELEPASTNAAVAATAGVVRTYNGKAILAEFSSSNGGFSTDGRVPYLVAKPDPWDGVSTNSVHSWVANLPVSVLEQRYPALGYLTGLRITSRDGNGEWGGRVGTVLLEGIKDGVPTQVVSSGREAYLARTWPAVKDGLKHQWWKPRPQAPAPPPGTTPPPVTPPPGTTPPPANPTPVVRSTDLACPPGEVPAAGFTDVPAGNVHARSIDCLVWWGVAQGRSSTSYAPAGTVTRAQMATFVANTLTQSGGDLPAPTQDWFADDDVSRHQGNINALRQAGIVGGRADGSYGPDAPVSREAMAAFLARAVQYRTGQPMAERGDYFADDTASVHEADINRVAAAGITGGSNGRYHPGQSVTRDQMGSFLARTLDLFVVGGQARQVPPTTRPEPLPA